MVVALEDALQPLQRLAMLGVRVNRAPIDDNIHDVRTVQIDWASPIPRKVSMVVWCLGVAHLVAAARSNNSSSGGTWPA